MNNTRLSIYGFYKYNKDDAYLVYSTYELDNLQMAFKRYMVEHYYKKAKTLERRINILIFQTDNLRLDLEDIDEVKLSSLCVDIRVYGYETRVKGYYWLARETVYITEIIRRFCTFTKFKERLREYSRQNLIDHIKKNHIPINTNYKLDVIIRNELINYEIDKILREHYTC